MPFIRSFQKKSNRSGVIFIASAVLIIALVVISTIALNIYLLQYGMSSDKSYGVVFDAGSTHTSMYIYVWPSDKSSGSSGTASISQIQDLYQKPGISSIRNLSEIGSYFRNFTNLMNAAVPKSSKKLATFKLGATAGMRLLRLQNSTFANRLFLSIFLYFSDTEFTVKPRNVQEITGTHEGLYAWVSANIISNSIPKKDDVPTIGIVEMGGASSQIAYEADNSTASSTDVVPVRLFGQSYNVYAESRLCFGKEQSANRYFYALLEDNKEKFSQQEIVIEDACQFKRSEVNFNLTEFRRFPCVDLLWNLEIPNLETKKVKFVGIGNLKTCREIAARIFNSSVLGLKISANRDYYALGAFIYLYKNLGLPTENTSMQTIYDVVQSLSSLSLEEVYAKYPNIAKSYVKTIMYDAVYMMQFLSAVGFNDEIFKKLHIVKTINNKEVNWAFGFMINETNLIEPLYPQFKPNIKDVIMATILIIVLGTLLTIIFFFIHSYSK